jgi:hypothetical protein
MPAFVNPEMSLLFPHEGEDLRIMWAVLGIILGGTVAAVGVLMLKEEPGTNGKREGRSRR